MATLRHQSWSARFALLVISTGLVTAGATIVTSPASAAGSAAMSSMEKRAYDNVNAQRRANGCAPLVIDLSLQKAAHDYAVEMVRTHHFSHTSVTGRGPTERARAAGYRGSVGENIMMGFHDPNGVVNDGKYGWMHSPGHRANIVNCSYTKTGMGYDPGSIDRAYSSGSWVQDFS